MTEKMKKNGKYGLDAPIAPITFFAIGLVLIILSIVGIKQEIESLNWCWFWGVFSWICGGIYLHTSFRGKFIIWANILDQLTIQPDSKILDLGCGRGAVLLMEAKRLGNKGKAVGIDLWQTKDQSGNDINVTKQNAKLEGVSDKVEIKTANMTDLPFEDESFDFITASVSIHNIKEQTGRRKALTEAYRVLKKEGTLIIVDIKYTKKYMKILQEIGMKNIKRKNAGWKGWWAAPWMPTHIVTAEK